MLVGEVMSSPAITVRRTDPVRQAIRSLHGHHITAAPVTDDTDHLVGVVSELDLLRVRGDRIADVPARTVPGIVRVRHLR
ncbi:CBS domain-containing protein [Nonomuraea sp. NPDC052129]|uniref:CBS domain-containing protein n=1 Tax=Nonomuraea sp. NPDC052129 TaxID=3154651 RepID=UPI00342DCC4A